MTFYYFAMMVRKMVSWETTTVCLISSAPWITNSNSWSLDCFYISTNLYSNNIVNVSCWTFYSPCGSVQLLISEIIEVFGKCRCSRTEICILFLTNEYLLYMFCLRNVYLFESWCCNSKFFGSSIRLWDKWAFKELVHEPFSTAVTFLWLLRAKSARHCLVNFF